MKTTVQATRAVRLALDDLPHHQGTWREIHEAASRHRPVLSEVVTARTLKRLVRKGEIHQVAGIYQRRGPNATRRPKETTP